MTNGLVISSLLGLMAGLGLLLAVHGVRKEIRQPKRLARYTTIQWSPTTVVRVGITIAVGIAVAVLTGWIIGGLLAGVIAWILPQVLRGDRENKKRIEHAEAIATWTDMLRDTMAAAAGLEQAILATAHLAPIAIRPDITELAEDLKRGQPLPVSLHRLANRLANPTADLVIAALSLASDQPTRHVSILLDALARSAREQASMTLRVDAGRARTRSSARIVALTTAAFACGLVVLNRPYLSAYDSGVGQLVLLIVGFLFCVGFAWLIRITKSTDPDRVLVNSAAAHKHNPAEAAP